MTPKPEDRYFIRLNQSCYEVRIRQGFREIRREGKWLSASKFIAALSRAGKHQEVDELAKGAVLLAPDKVAKVFAIRAP